MSRFHFATGDRARITIAQIPSMRELARLSASDSAAEVRSVDFDLMSSGDVWIVDSHGTCPPFGDVQEIASRVGAVVVVRIPSVAYPGRWRTLYEARP